MKKLICSALSCVMAAAMLAGCSLPGMEQDNDDTIMSDSYSTEADNTEQAQNYSWIIQPSVSADNIISFDGSQVNPDDEKNTAYANYSVIRLDGKCGLIDYKGNIVVAPAYDDYYTCWCGEITLFNVIDEKNGEYEYCTIDSSNQVVNYVADHEDESSEYFWDSSSNKVFVKKKNETTGTEYTGKKTVVVGEADISEAENDEFFIEPKENSLYGLAKKGELILDITYKDYYAPAYKGAGLTCIAFEDENDKWGYVGSDGKTIIDFKCDSDVNSYCGKVIDDETVSHPYLFTGDYVPVLVNSSYGYYDIDGNCIVKAGEFEQARPVHNGRAWVRKDGLWGVIQIGEIVEDDTAEEESSSKAETTTTKWSTTTTTASSTSASTVSTSDTAVTTKKTEATVDTEVTVPSETETPVTQPTETAPVTQPTETAPVTQAPIETVPAQ